MDGNQRIKLSHIKEYAIKKKIVTPYFGEQSNADEEKREFENIVNSIRLHFQPEKITHEEHLEAQLTIFLKAKFPERKVERQIFSKSGDRLDILIDNKYVFELKVPKNKTDLRNLSAQIDEYIENYPNICVVIADTSQIPAEKEEEKVEAGLSENIRDYVEKYKLKYRVQTVVFNIELRK